MFGIESIEIKFNEMFFGVFIEQKPLALQLIDTHALS